MYSEKGHYIEIAIICRQFIASLCFHSSPPKPSKSKSKSFSSSTSSLPNKNIAVSNGKPAVIKEEKTSSTKSTAEKLSKFANYKIPSKEKIPAESKPIPKLTKVESKPVKKEEKPGKLCFYHYLFHFASKKSLL